MGKLKRSSYPLYFLMPGLALYIMFLILPNFVGLWYSFTNWNFRRADFIGLRNYINILGDPKMNIALYNTFFYTIVTTAGKMVLGMLLALFLQKKFALTGYLRTVFYLPAVINMVAIGIVFRAMMHPTRGLINNIFGVEVHWLTNTNIAMLSISLIEIWKWTGFTAMFFIAGLMSVSTDYYEAAVLDGANAWQKFWKVTLPLLLPAINNALILNLVGGLGVFEAVSATTGGGPGMSTQVLNTLVYKSFTYMAYGEAAAGGLILGFFVFTISFFTYRRIAAREVEL